MRLINLLTVIAISPLIAFLWLLKEVLFWSALRVTDVMLLLNPRDIEWMPREMIKEEKQRVDVSHQKMMKIIVDSIKG